MTAAVGRFLGSFCAEEDAEGDGGEEDAGDTEMAEEEKEEGEAQERRMEVEVRGAGPVGVFAGTGGAGGVGGAEVGGPGLGG